MIDLAHPPRADQPQPRRALRRFVLGAAASSLLAAACGSGGGAGGGSASGVDPAPVGQVDSTSAEDVPSALRGDRYDPAFPEALIDPALILSGGPPPDGIPAIDEPRFLAATDVDFLEDDEPVLALEIGGEARAYPVQIMTWHELVNDTVGDLPVTVSFCPLCNSAVAYDRRLGDRVLDFGTSGSLYQSSMVMYDRQTESLWTHFDGRSVIGWLAGDRLDLVPVQTVSWSTFRDAHPDGLVLSRDTGHSRDYGRNPYPGYDSAAEPIGAFLSLEVDGRLGAKDRVVGVRDDAASTAVPLPFLAAEGALPFVHGDRPLVAFHLPGTASSLDAPTVAGGGDVGATGVFVPADADGTPLTFARQGDMFVDAETGTAWSILGEAVDGPLAGQSLEAVEHVDTFWFAWATFQPATVIVGL